MRSNKKRKQSQVINMDDARKNSQTNSYIPRPRNRQVEIIPRNVAQEAYVERLLDEDNKINIAIGPAGTGKTLLAVLRAIEMFKNGDITRIVVTRPAVSVDEQHGFLPGDLNAKMEPWTRPIFDVFEEYYNPHEIKAMMEDRVIEIAPLGYMRGRTFKNAYIIGDEMQNATPDQMKMLLTRIGEGTYIAVTGDLKQHDRGFDANGLYDFTTRLEDAQYKGVAISEFNKGHVERDPIVKTVLDIYGED